MALYIQKYGGTSVATPERLRAVAARVAATVAEGHQVVVVVSAMGLETDRLAALALEVCAEPDARERDVLLAAGEQVSAALLAMALVDAGLQARSYLGHQVRFLTDAAHGCARILDIETETLAADLAAGCVPVVAGFQGVGPGGDVTTFGRGGSDTTAVALAAALEAEECQIFTDVDGVYTSDPALVESARRLSRVSGEEMLEFASQGSRVLQNRAVEFAGRHGVPLRVLPAHGEGEGTRIDFSRSLSERPMVTGVACRPQEVEFRLRGLEDRPGVAYRLLQPLHAAGIEVDMIVHQTAREGGVDLGFTVGHDDLERARVLVSEAADALGAEPPAVHDGVAKVSLVGMGLRSHAGIASKLFDTLGQAEVNVRMVSTSESRISVLVLGPEAERAVAALHRAFELGEGAKV